jgi:LysM repeat protein
MVSENICNKNNQLSIRFASMKNIAIRLSTFCALLAGSQAFGSTPFDSVGIERKGDKVYVLHKVEPKQTLFSILKRYGSSLTEYRTENPGIEEAVKTDQLVRVPYKKKVWTPAAPSSKPQTDASATSSGINVHTVGTSEGLYRIALKYNTTMANLRLWNSLASDNLQPGQQLVVTEQEYLKRKREGTPAPIPPKPAPEVATPKAPEPVKPAPVEQPKTEEKDDKPTSRTEPVNDGNLKNVIEKGVAELIDVEDSSGKYLALHRTAPIGTMVMITNESNNQKVYVKVIGSLPEGAANDKVVIRLSPKAFEKLQSTDPRRARVEVVYVAQ